MHGAARAVARHELRRLAGAFSGSARWTTLAGVLLLAASLPALQSRGVHPDRDLFPIHADEAGPYAAAASADPRLHAVPAEQDAALEVGAASVEAADSDAGRAAYVELRDALARWQEGELAREPDAAAAFPVRVELAFATRDLTGTSAGAAGATTTLSPSATTTGAGPAAPGPTANASILDAAPDARTQTDLRPGDVQPPFPITSLLLTFAYLIPMNFVAQVYAGTLMGERIRRRGLLLLSTPHAPASLLWGRTIPYVAAALLVWVAASVLIGTGPGGWLASFPIVAFVLAAALVIGLVARSERELTFMLTGTTTMFTTFLFLPAVFTALPPVAYLSPVSVVGASIRGEGIALGSFLYATVPLALSVTALGFVGAGMFREETMFSQARLGWRLRSGIAAWTTTAPRLVAAGILAVPFAMALLLFLLAFAIPLGLRAAFPVFILGTAIVEEALKRAAARAGPPTIPPWRRGAWVGLGFFVGEKLALVVALAGFGAVTFGVSTLQLFGVAGSWVFLLAPLAVHMAASALAASGHGRWSRATFWGGCLLHIAYNLAVIAAGAL